MTQRHPYKLELPKSYQMPLRVCEICGAVGKTNPNCTACRQWDEEMTYDLLTEQWLDDRYADRPADYDGEEY
jgi:hypothetical protein